MVLQKLLKDLLKGGLAGLISITVFIFYLLFSIYCAPKIGGQGRTWFGDIYFFGFGFLLYTFLKGITSPKTLYEYLNIFFILGAVSVLEISATAINYFIKDIFVNLNIGIAGILTIILISILISFIINKIPLYNKQINDI